MVHSVISDTHVGHGTWVPNRVANFENQGKLFIWIETASSQNSEKKHKSAQHPNHISDSDSLVNFLSSSLLFGKSIIDKIEPEPIMFHIPLPGTGEQPLPSIEMARMRGVILPEDSTELKWYFWEVKGLFISQPMLFFKELHYITSFDNPNLYLGEDLKFWIRFSRLLGNLVSRHQFLPVMKCFHTGGKNSQLQVCSGWTPAAEQYEQGLQDFANSMPDICKVVYKTEKPKKRQTMQVDSLSSLELLRQFSDQQLDMLVSNSGITKSILNRFKGNWPQTALESTGKYLALTDQQNNTDEISIEDWRKWRTWQQAILGYSGQLSVADSKDKFGFVLGIRLQQIDNTREDALRVAFFVSARHDPSLQINLEEWWGMSTGKQSKWLKHFGKQFERNLLVNLGHAARMCPLLWQSLETSRPTGLDIDIETAYEFLKNDALVLESAGFRVLLPSWWTPKGRRRALLRVNASTRSKSSASVENPSGYFKFDSLVRFRYELSVGGEPVSPEEWRELANAKAPLVRFRGEWMELDRDHMSKMLELLHEQEYQQTDKSATFSEILKEFSEADENTTEYVFDEVLNDILERLNQKETMEPIDNPVGLNGELRPYQKLGLSWLATMESLGLNPCLADDMGLGKTIQVIALLLYERAISRAKKGSKVPNTLLIAPTSVMSNWQKEIHKFAPNLKCMIHHGADRITTAEELHRKCEKQDVLITSFSIARRDNKLLNKQEWGRVVVDEAQNIKNPKSAQAKSICALNAKHRVALTGTPVENRLMDMWSLFNFLNPGYLGNQTQFRKAYELPIQRYNDHTKTRQLQRLAQPFILRRMKTDPTIINDLPDKVEQKVYCNLTKEQASLYQAVVDQVQIQMEEADGIQRRGIMLATLMKLKQICNHPAQFLQDSSPFSEARSHKLARLNEMVEEALEEMDSMLVFTQFVEVGTELESLIRNKYRCPVYYLHGGVSRQNRQRMIDNFQDPTTPASVFILSLRAGGTGITLTRANHVFHVDRWWNPAVENQATDRAYRIGQKKSVFVHKMVTLGTLEERIDEMIENKQALADSIVGTDENWLTEMDNQQFKQLISLNRQTIMEVT